MKHFLIVLLIILSFNAQAFGLKEYYELDPNLEDNAQEIKKLNILIDEIEGEDEKDAIDYFLLFAIGSDRLTYEAKQKIFIEKAFTRDEYFSSGYFLSQYSKFEEYVKKSILGSLSNHSPITYKEVSRILSNPFFPTSIREEARKYSLKILKDSELGNPEHPMTRDQYVYRVFKRTAGEYCGEGKCEEAKRLAEEMLEIAPALDTEAKELVDKYYAPNKPVKAAAEVVVNTPKSKVAQTSLTKKTIVTSVVKDLDTAKSQVKPVVKTEPTQKIEPKDNTLWYILAGLLLALVAGGIAIKRRN